MRPSHQITELPLRVERPLTRLLWAVRDKQVMPDAQGSHTYAQGVRTLAGPPIQPELGDFNKARVGTISRNETVAGQSAEVTIESGELTIEATDLEYRYIDQFFPESGTDGRGIAEIGQNHTKMNLFDDLVNSQLIVLAQDNGGVNVEVGASQPIEIIFRPSDSSAVEPITQVVLTNYEVDFLNSTPDDAFTSDVHDLSVSWRPLAAATKISAKKTNDAGYTVLNDFGQVVDTSNTLASSTFTELITTFTFVNTTRYDEYKITIEANHGGAEYFDPDDPTGVDENILDKDGIFLSLLEMQDTDGNVIVGRTNVPDEDEIEILGGEETFGFNATALSSLSSTALDVIIDGNSSAPTSRLGVRTADGTYTLKYTPNAPKSIEQVRLNSSVPGGLQRYAKHVPVLDKVYGVKDGDKNEISANLISFNPATLVYNLGTVDSHDSYEFEMKSGATVASGQQNYYDIVYPIETATGFINYVQVLNQSYLGEFELIEAAEPDVTFATPVDVATSRLDMGPGSLHLWGDRFDFRTTDAQGNELVDPLEHVQLKLDAQDRLPDDSNMRVAYYRLVDPHEHASRSQGQQPGAYSYTFARDADSLSREGPERAVTGSINLARIHDKVLRLKHRVPGRDAVLFAWAECLDVFELGSGLGSYGMRHA